MKSKFLISILVAVLLTTSYGYARQDPNKSVGVIAKSGPLQGVTAYTDTYALFVGISDYANKDIPSIPSAENDAKTMRDTLVTKFGFNPDPSHTVVLTGSRATKTNIEAELARLSNTNRVHKTDRVFVYFSCHGQRVPLPNGEAAGYLLPHGATVSLNDVTNPSEYQTRHPIQLPTIGHRC